MMPYRFLLLMAGVLLSVASIAQPTVTLLTFESYTFEEGFSTEYGDGRVGDGFQYGGGLEFGANEYVSIELIYQYMSSTVRYQGWDTQYTGSIGINYALIGGTHYKPFSDVVSGFGTIDLGVGWFNPDESLMSESVTKFAVGGRLGLRFQPVDSKVSIRIHGQVLSPVQWAGGGFYFGTGGSGAGVSTGSTIWQWNVGGSLNIRLK